MGFEQYIIGRAQDWVQGRLPQGADRAIVAKILRGHLMRLRDQPAGLEASLAHPDPDPSTAINLINGVRREIEGLAAQLSGDADVNVPTDLFYRLIDAVVIGADSQDEGVRKSGRELFNATVRDLPLMLAAENEAKSANDAYIRGNDLPRLLVGAVAILRNDLNETAMDLIGGDQERMGPLPKPPRPESGPWPMGGWYLPSYFLQQPTVSQYGLAAADSETDVSLDKLIRQLAGRPEEDDESVDGALTAGSPAKPVHPQVIRISVNAGVGALFVDVYDSATASEPSNALDGWRARATRSDAEWAVKTVTEGKCTLNVGTTVNAANFRIQFSPPDSEVWLDCRFAARTRQQTKG